MSKKWDRQKGENSKWFERFECYRMAGPGRTLLGTVNEMLVNDGEKRRNSPPNSWFINFDKYNWKTRAEAWDDHQRHKDRVENEKARQKARKARAELIMAGIEKCKKAVDVVDPASAKFGEIMAGIKTLNEQARIEFGDNTIITPVSHDILVDLISGEITVREAALRYNQEGVPIPKAVEIMLSKESPEEAAVDETVVITEEELEARYQAVMAETRKEEAVFLPERRAAVEAMKAELADQDQWTDAKIFTTANTYD